MTHKEIHERALAVSTRYRQSENELLTVLQEIDACKTFREYGCTSLYQYAITHLKLSDDAAYNFITVARRAVMVPALKQEIQNGSITVSKARKICSVITPVNQKQWLELARCSSQKRLEKEVARVNPKEAVQEKATYVTGDRLALQLGISESLLRKLKRVQDLEAQSKQRHVDLEATLEAVLDLYLERKDPVKRAERINAKRPVLRRVKADLKHQVKLRDQGKCSKCGATRWLDVHHIVPKEQGGKDTLENLTTLCRAHHQREHRLQ